MSKINERPPRGVRGSRRPARPMGRPGKEQSRNFWMKVKSLASGCECRTDLCQIADGLPARSRKG